jgi:hypothetical protein
LVFSFFFFPFLGSYWQPFSYVLALLAILKTKRSAKIMCSFWDFSKARMQPEFKNGRQFSINGSSRVVKNIEQCLRNLNFNI